MQSKGIIIVFLVLMGCKKPFPTTPETLLALPLKLERQQESIVFITGFDQGDNAYYANAKRYFREKGIPVVDSLYSLEEIIIWLDQKAEDQVAFSEIHIVSHSNPWLGMSLRTIRDGERITVGTLQDAKRQNLLPKIKHAHFLSKETKIVFHSCGLGENLALLRELKHTFFDRTEPQIYASRYFNVFGGKFAGHYLAKPYYGFYPTGESKGPLYLSEEFKKAYPETEIDWFSALKTRTETQAGMPYSYKFNIPINWEFTFDDVRDIPPLQNREALLDFISESPEMAETLLALNIPLEKYRWKSDLQGNTLRINGKTTVLCVLAPILQDAHGAEYQNPNVSDPMLYQIL